MAFITSAIEDIVPDNCVLRAYFQIKFVFYDASKKLHDYRLQRDSFESFEDEIRLLHRGILSVLIAIDVPVHQFVALGLRTCAEEWQDLPKDAGTGMAEIQRLVHRIEPLINMRNGNVPVQNYHMLFGVEFEDAIDRIYNYFQDHPLSTSNRLLVQNYDGVPESS